MHQSSNKTRDRIEWAIALAGIVGWSLFVTVGPSL